MKKFFITTFGCQQNTADSERLTSFYASRGFAPADTLDDADILILNTCVIRDRAEEKVYGMIRSIRSRLGAKAPQIVVTGCLIGAALRVPGGKMMRRLKKRLPDVTFLPIDEVGFEHIPKRAQGTSASVVISNGCNNYCAFCIVPFSRGQERSRSFAEILSEVTQAVQAGYTDITLLGQNVNSYGADFLKQTMQEKALYILPDGTSVKPVMVKHLNRQRIPTLFPYLLEYVARIAGIQNISFLSSNPWDFSDELIDVMARYPNISRTLHLPIQSGSNTVLKRMNRFYTREEYYALIENIRSRIPEIIFTTDIIVGFPGETQAEFEETLDVIRHLDFAKTFIAWYSPRPGTTAMKMMPDDVPREEKQRRFHLLDTIAYKGKKRL